MADYTHRFTSQTLMFRIEGRPPCNGGKSAFGGVRKAHSDQLNPKVKRKQTEEEHRRAKANNKSQYMNIVRLMARTAMAQQKWEITDQPVYMVLTFYVNYAYAGRKADIEAIYESDVPPTRTPKFHSVIPHYVKGFEGVVYKNASQIAGLLVLKRYTKGLECVDILIGKPATFKELVNDIRNN